MAVKNNCLACNLPVNYTNSDDEVGELAYHKECTKCHKCGSPLASIMPCLFYKGHLYCDTTCVKDAPRELRCHKCMKILIGEDLVRKIENHYYHAHCFRCNTCNKMLTTGQKYEIQRTRVFCATHKKRKTVSKRKSFNRTNINEVQRKILEKHFDKNKFPTMLDMMKICSKTDLPHDTVKYWFQNNRTRKGK